MAKKPIRKGRRTRRKYSNGMKAEAVQMLLDGHSAASVAENLECENRRLAENDVVFP